MKKITKVDEIYGCSMGGSIVLRLLANQNVKIENAFIDGGIDLLEKAFATDEYSKEDLEYVVEVFDFVSNRTLWNTFDSCNNYKMPRNISDISTKIEYWYAENEKNERKKDFDFMKKNFPATEFIEMQNLGHAGMALFRPKEMAERIKR